MKKKIVAGNWKMNHTLSSAEELLRSISNETNIDDHVGVWVFPPNLYAKSAAQILNHKTVDWGIQNVFHENCGAFTGEVNVDMLESMNGAGSLVGHSERRKYFHETNEDCNKKVNKLLAKDLHAFLCCGEPEHEREEGNHINYVLKQLENCLSGIEWHKKLVIAYEPVWAIGTGKTANPEEIAEMHNQIANFLQQKWGDEASQTPILYGGSCNPKNAKDIFCISNVDGGLIGGASLKADDFQKIIKAAHESS